MSADVFADILAKLAYLDIPEKKQLLSGLTQEIYRRSFDAYRSGLYAQDWEDGKKAKELKVFRADGLLVSRVDEQRAKGVSIKTAVADFLRTMAVGKFLHELPPDLSDQEGRAALRKFLERRARDPKKLGAEQRTAERRYFDEKKWEQTKEGADYRAAVQACAKLLKNQ
jgi:hypothetical protein